MRLLWKEIKGETTVGRECVWKQGRGAVGKVSGGERENGRGILWRPRSIVVFDVGRREKVAKRQTRLRERNP